MSLQEREGANSHPRPAWQRYLLVDLGLVVVLGGIGAAVVALATQGGFTVTSQSALAVRPTVTVTSPAAGTVAAVPVTPGATVTTDARLATVTVSGGPRAVRAPVAGSVEALDVVPGQSVSAGQIVATVTAAHGPVRVLAMVSETVVHQVKIGQSATVTLPAYPSRTLNGRVSAVWPETAQAYIGQAGMPAPPAQEFLKQIQLVPIAITLTDPPRSLASGESAEVTIHVG